MYQKVESLPDTTSATTLILDILAFGSVRNKASCWWYFCIAALRDWQYLVGRRTRAFYQALELLGDSKKGVSWFLGVRCDV